MHHKERRTKVIEATNYWRKKKNETCGIKQQAPWYCGKSKKTTTRGNN